MLNLSGASAVAVQKQCSQALMVDLLPVYGALSRRNDRFIVYSFL